MSNMSFRLCAVLAILPVMFLSGCGGGSSPSKCVADASLACVCLGQQSGVQVCTSSGTYGTCVCGATPTADASGGDTVASLLDAAAAGGSVGSGGTSASTGGTGGGATSAGGSSGSGGSSLDASMAGTGGVVGSRQLDLVVMVDNSPSMAPKVTKMNAQFPKLIAALKNPNDGTFPDLRVAIIDSDLGTGNAYSSGSCGPKTLADGTVSLYGDMGQFQMLTSPTACTFNAGAQYLEYKSGVAVNYTGDISTVFGCLAGNVGTSGCGMEHQLQAFEFALAARGIGNETQQQMLRPNAYLGLVFLTDEDDCSAASNDGMFGPKTELQGETASLRCATRAHACGGRNLTASPPGYPTDSAYSHPFNDCQARTDACPNQTDGNGSTDTSQPTDCSPLKDIHHLALELKGLKADPDHQILVAGIFGWPLGDADMATAQYKIAPVPNPNVADTQHPAMYDYWPVCYDPNHMPAASTTDVKTGYDAVAVGWGATGGLRESAFVDEFGDNGLKFSICQPDFSASMTAIGNAIVKNLPNGGSDGGPFDAPMVRPGTGGSGTGGHAGAAGGAGGSLDACSSDGPGQCKGAVRCESPEGCGDGINDQNGIEECDDGNVLPGDGCDGTCHVEPNWTCPKQGACRRNVVCGDGTIGAGELCDDGNTLNGDGCSADCTAQDPAWKCAAGQPCVRVSQCGNKRIEPGEDCDDGNTKSGDGCGATCHIEAGWTCAVPGLPCRSAPRCGDGVVQTAVGEVCDDGNQKDGDGCSADCKTMGPGCTCNPGMLCICPGACGNGGTPCPPPGTCGNGIVEGGEACDDGTQNVNTTDPSQAYGGCMTNCMRGAFCGDGLWNGKEACDDGINDGTYGTCNPDCTPAPRCGDGVVQANYGEECEPTMSNDPNCTDACRVPGGCGDGKIQPPEQCDDGAQFNTGDYGGCAPSCIFAPHCGDGIKNGPEQCDDGILDSRYGGCTPQCKLAPHCGDGIVNGPEECDPGLDNGGNSGCTTYCRLIVCTPL